MKATLSAPTPPRSTPATIAANSSSTPYVPPFTIIVDTREGAPFTFAGMFENSERSYRPRKVAVEHQGLPTGDYSLKGFTNRVTIERKSLPDLMGSLAGKEGVRRDRFKREHERMWEEFVRWGGFAHVVIEATREDVRAYREDQAAGRPRGAHPNAVLSASIRWPRRYGVQWHWAGGRAEAERLTYDLLADAYHVFEEEEKDKSRAERNAAIERLKNLNNPNGVK